MMNFKFHVQSPVYFGRGVVRQYADLIASYGKKAMIVTTQFPEGCPNLALEDALAVCAEKGIEATVFDKTEENPSVENVLEIVRAAQAAEADFFMGVGGGSPMDAAKCASVLMERGITEDEAAYDLLFLHPEADKYRRPFRCRPVICVPTTAGSSSEITGFFVITRKDTGSKQAPSIMVFSEASFLDPRYIEGAPQLILDTGAMDALSHGIETSINVNSNFMNQQIALIGFRLFNEFKDHLLSGELTAEDYEKIMLHSAIQGMAFYQAGTLLPHGLGYYLSHEKGVNHGLACSLTQGEFLRVVGADRPDLIAPIISACGFKDVEDFASYMDAMTSRNVHIHVTEQECEEWADHFMKYQGHRLKRYPGTIGRDDLVRIFKKSLRVFMD